MTDLRYAATTVSTTGKEGQVQTTSFTTSAVHHEQSSSVGSHPGVDEETIRQPLVKGMAEHKGGAAGGDGGGQPSQYPPGHPAHDAMQHDEDPGCCSWLLTGLSWIAIICTLPFSLYFCFKIVQEYERAVIFRLGRLLTGGAKGPGLFFIVPCIDVYRKVDLRVVSFDVPPQEILTKDSVTVAVDAVVYFRISNPAVSVTNVEDAHHSTRLLAQTTLRNILGTKTLAEILADREHIATYMKATLDDATDPWGVKVERVEVKDVRLPQQLQRAMAAEAEATREARAKVIAAEGEQKASRALKEAADVISEAPAALQLRYLQTLSSISAEKNSTIIFPVPIDLLRGFIRDKCTSGSERKGKTRERERV